MVLHVKANVIIPTQEKAFRLIQEIAKLDHGVAHGIHGIGSQHETIDKPQGVSNNGQAKLSCERSYRIVGLNVARGIPCISRS